MCYSINLPDDSISEGIESFAVVFTSNNSSDKIRRKKATVTITDDDGKYFLLYGNIKHYYIDSPNIHLFL